MAHPYLEQLQQLLRDLDPGSSDVSCKHFFSGAAAYLGGHIFASLTPKGFALKLPETKCEELLSRKFTEPLRYFDNSPVRWGYVLFPEHDRLSKNDLRQFVLESKSNVTSRSYATD